MVSRFLSGSWPVGNIRATDEDQDIPETTKPVETVGFRFVADPTKLCRQRALRICVGAGAAPFFGRHGPHDAHHGIS